MSNRQAILPARRDKFDRDYSDGDLAFFASYRADREPHRPSGCTGGYRMRVHCEMTHNRAFAVTRLRNTALLFERGECDRDFAELGIDITDERESVAERIRQLADAIEGAEG